MSNFDFDTIKACFPRGTVFNGISMQVDRMPISFGYYGGGIIEHTDVGRTITVTGFNLDLTRLHPGVRDLSPSMKISSLLGNPITSTFELSFKLRDADCVRLCEIAKEVFESEFIEDFETAEYNPR